MKTLTTLISASLLAFPVAVSAQSNDTPFAGSSVGLEGMLDSNQARKPTTATTTTTNTKRPKRQGVGIRAYAGYDAVIGDTFLIGVEAGLGKSAGALTLDAAGNKIASPKKATKTEPLKLGVNQYRVDPGLTYDATARVGLLASNSVLVYARGGYRWLKTKQFTGPVTATGVTTSKKVTEGGFTFGGGLEFAASRNFSIRAEYNRTNFSKDFKQNKFSIGAALRF